MPITEFTEAQRADFERRGIKLKTGRALNFIGKTHGRTFRDVAQAHAANFTPDDVETATLGGVYETAPYRAARLDDAAYEAVYGSFDWTGAVTDPELKKVLEENFGDTGRPIPVPASGVESLRAAYADKIPVPNTSALLEVRDALGRVTNRAVLQQDQDTSGIRGIDDDEFEPVG